MSHVRIAWKGYHGTQSTPGVAFNYNSQAAWERCKKREDGHTGLRLYGETADSNSASVLQPAIGLDYQVVYESGRNGSTNWTATAIGNAAWLVNTSNAFQSGLNGCLYVHSGSPSTKPKFTSNFTIAESAAFALRFHLLKPSAKRQLVAWQWGDTGAGVRFELMDGEARLCLLSVAWNQTDQTALDALRQQSDNLTALEQDDITAYETALYDKIKPLDGLGFDSGAVYNRDVEIVFTAEPRGRIHINVKGAGELTIDNDSVIGNRATSALWSAGALTYSLNRGATFWQVGTVYYRESGVIKLPPERWFYSDPLSTLGVVHNGQADTSATGSGVAFDFDESNSLFPRFYATLTGNGTGTPFLYSFASFAAGGERDGDNTIFFDTDNWGDGNRLSEFKISCEGEKKRVKIEGVLSNDDNFLELPLLGRELADRLCDVYFDGVIWLGNLLCTNVTVAPINIENISGTDTYVCTGETTIEFEACDMETQGDMDLMTDDPVLDGLKLGDALWYVLRGAGWTDAELAGISRTAGPTLDAAVLGESPAVRPERESPRGDFVDYLMEQFGIGYELDSYAGVWALRTIGSLATTTLDPLEVSELEMSRDNRDVKNIFRLEGGGEEIIATFDLAESYTVAVPPWDGYMGRMVRMATVQDSGRRTLGMAATGVRSVMRQNAKPGEFVSFEYFLSFDLLPRRRFMLCGVEYEVERMEPREWTSEPRMGVTARQVIALP